MRMEETLADVNVKLTQFTALQSELCRRIERIEKRLDAIEPGVVAHRLNQLETEVREIKAARESDRRASWSIYAKLLACASGGGGVVYGIGQFLSGG